MSNTHDRGEIIPAPEPLMLKEMKTLLAVYAPIIDDSFDDLIRLLDQID